MVFEGEYREGKRYKGKEYYNNKLDFEGEFLNKKRKKGKEYQDGRLIYVGEYSNGGRWNGKEYNEVGKIKADYSFGIRKSVFV